MVHRHTPRFAVVRRAIAAFAAVTAVLVAVGARDAAAATPWWHLTSGASPTSLREGVAEDEIQVLTVNASGGEFALERQFSEEREAPPNAGPEHVKAGAQPGEVQAALEALYGAGNVEVTGSDPYTVRFTAALADQAVLPILASGAGLTGTPSEVTVAESKKGRPDGEIVFSAENLGDGSIESGGKSVTLADVLPSGLRAVGIAGTAPKEDDLNNRLPLACVLESHGGSCHLPGVLGPFQESQVRVAVVVEPGFASGRLNVVSASGGGARAASAATPVTLSSAPTPFGIEDYELVNEEEGGSPARQAGSHPFQQTTTLDLNQGANVKPLSERSTAQPAVLPKDLNFIWPAGLIGNPSAVPQCKVTRFLTGTNSNSEDLCPPETAVGVVSVTVNEPLQFGRLTLTVPLFNLEPAEGEPARFGFFVQTAAVPVVIDTAVRTGDDYGITVKVHNISETAGFLSSKVTVWGVPGDPRHDNARGWGCLLQALGFPEGARSACTLQAAAYPPPFLSLPTSCTGALGTTVQAASWESPGVFEPFSAPPVSALYGCNQLPFSAQINVSPDGQAASTPTGLNVDVHVPQDTILNGAGLASSDVKNISVTFPEGVTLNPAAADGLLACSETQIGYLPSESTPPEDLHFTPTLPEAFCPSAAKVGTVTIKTPLLPAGQFLRGALYLASPAPNAEDGQNPFRSLIAAYIVAKDPISGVLVKLAGEVTLDPGTGRITTTFKNSPQVAFEDAEIHLFNGDRAPFATPAHCGSYMTEATFTPWSGTPPVKSESSFGVTSGPHGDACPSVLPFSPSLATGTTNINAGGFSPLSTTISREDGNQNIQTVQLRMPPGLSGILKGVPLCPEARANAGSCGPESLIGHTVVSVGLGGDPFSVTGGQVFLTEGYKGASFGLSIVNPAKAGPFDLGKVVVRAKVEVDPHTTQLMVTTDEIPHILHGIPLQIKHVNATIDRAGFTFNPTNCGPFTVMGAISSVEGASSTVSVPFQVANCATLKFAPKFSVSTSGKASRAKGASLTAKLSYPKAPQGTQTNITRVKVDLPKQLPSRLTTLQKACTNAQFESNPANCPVASKIGRATVTTPLLPVPLVGPAIFVSHGGEAFPSLTVVLQGYGVTVDLVGTTFISKAGITSTTFKTVPDVPFNTFTLTLPQGKYSALAANGNLCRSKLTMPTEFLAQNGLVIHQSTKIAVTSCFKHKAKRKTKNKKRGKGRKK